MGRSTDKPEWIARFPLSIAMAHFSQELEGKSDIEACELGGYRTF